MDPTLQTLLTGLGIAAVGGLTALVEKIRRDLEKNTTATQESKKAAEDSKKAAEDSQEVIQGMQVATFERLDYDRLRRIESAVNTLEECEPCREKILKITDRRRVYRPTPDDATEVK